MILFGTISEADPTKGKFRVDLDAFEIVTPWLRCITGNTKLNKDELHLDVGEHVALVMDDKLEEGVILGAIYNDKNLPPVGNQDKRRQTFEDGSFIEFDRSTGNYEINIKGDANITAAGNINAMCDGDLNAAVGGNLVATADGDMELNGTVIKLNGTGNNGIPKASVIKTKLNALEVDDNRQRAVVAAMATAATSAPTTPVTNATLYAFYSAVTFPITPMTLTSEPELRNDAVQH